MKHTRSHTMAIVLSTCLFLIQGAVEAQVPNAANRGYMAIDESIGAAGESKEAQIARAIAAGPKHVTDSARIMGSDEQGQKIVLREGSNGFTCVPGNPKVAGHPASCSNQAAQQWSADLAAGKPSPTNTTAGFIYMQAGATLRSASGETVEIGPQWMIIWPFDPQATGLSATEKDTGAYILWSGTPYAHLHIMGQAVGPSTLHLASEHVGHMPAMGVHDGAEGAISASDESAEVQIARALSAGPKHVTDGARIDGADAQGKRIKLREGDNGFVCFAGSLKNVAEPPVCNSLNSKPAIWYMFAGATQRSITDPNDDVSPSLAIAPHWMIMMHFDPATSGIPEHYSDVGAYLMWSGSRIGHMHINGIP
ncbi:MAG: hypothetical protein ABIQ86_08130 [Steroidobacteraceae bacterium]